MTKLEVLLLLERMIGNAVISRTDKDDASGCNTLYLVDHETLLRNIQSAIDAEKANEQ